MAKVAGVVKIRLNGVDYGTKQGASLELGGETKTSQFASGQRSGSSSDPTASKITLTVEVRGDTDLEALRNFEGIAEFIMDTGQEYSAGNSEVMEPPKINDNGGGADLSIEGDPAVPTT